MVITHFLSLEIFYEEMNGSHERMPCQAKGKDNRLP